MQIRQSVAVMVTVCFFVASSMAQRNDPKSTADEQSCRNLLNHPALTILSAQIREASGVSVGAGPRYCYVRGLISPAIHYHVQLPLPQNWNGRFLMRGDGGVDGTLDFSDTQLSQGYAVANSNTGHDAASEPGNSFGFNNRQAEIDFGYRAVHLTVSSAKAIVQAYYGKPPAKSYFEGCSTGGRQALMEAQRYPYDFDGIVAGAPANYYQALYASRIWLMQQFFHDHFAGNLAFDTSGDGVPDSLTKLNLLKDSVLAKCDAEDGIIDSVVNDPLTCRFDPAADLKSLLCAEDVNADGCFTSSQLKTIEAIYDGAHDSNGTLVYKGRSRGSEFSWSDTLIPHAGNRLMPAGLNRAFDRMNYTYYETDPGVPPENPADIYQQLNKNRQPPEYGWWEFNIDDVTAGRGNFMAAILDATDPDLTRFLKDHSGKLLLYHGWGDSQIAPEPTLDYYQAVVDSTFAGDVGATRDSARIFMFPGMGHCSGGPGPDEWDRLSPVVDWVEKGIAPDFLVANHRPNRKVDNQRKVCAYPQQAAYTGPAGGQNERAHWVHENFSCQTH